MFNSDVLEVATGIVFVYLLMSLVVTSAREVLEGWLKQRGKALEQGLVELFGAFKDGDPGGQYLQAFYNHPLIYSLYRSDYRPIDPSKGKRGIGGGGGELPSYIPASSFAHAVVDMIGGGAASMPLTAERLAAAVDAMPDGQLKNAVRVAVQTGEGDLARTRAFLEKWYDGTMDRVSGWYRRHTQAVVFCLSFVACVALNVNTVTIGEALFQNSSLRAAVVAKADEAARAGQEETKKNLNSETTALRAAGLPLGWGKDGLPPLQGKLDGNPVQSIVGGLELVVGWLMTAFAITLGAPFWFDVLNRIMVVRSTVKPTEKSKDERSKDGAGDQADAAAGAAGQAGLAAADGDHADVAAAPAPLPPGDPVDPAGQAEVGALDPSERPRED